MKHWLIAAAFVVGVCAGWWANDVARAHATGRFFAQDFAPFSFEYRKVPGSNWQSENDLFSYSAGIPTNSRGLVLPGGDGAMLPALHVAGAGTTTRVTLIEYVNAYYPPLSPGAVEYRTSMTPYTSADHTLSGYVVSYTVDGMAGYAGQALILHLNQQCNSPNPEDCGNVFYTIDNVAGRYSPSEFTKLLASITYVP